MHMQDPIMLTLALRPLPPLFYRPLRMVKEPRAKGASDRFYITISTLTDNDNIIRHRFNRHQGARHVFSPVTDKNTARKRHRLICSFFHLKTTLGGILAFL